MDVQEFDRWCQNLNLSERARSAIQDIRTANPSRRVGNRRGNVSGFYPSNKMGVTIQFESYRHELARIYELEHSQNVLEYYDQPPAIELCYQALSGRKNRHLYTPDFFVIALESAWWEECKSEQELIKLASLSPNRYCQDKDGVWHCPPGEDYAQKLDLDFRVWSSTSISWTFQENFIWLEDYLNFDEYAIKEQTIKTVKSLVEAYPGITLADLAEQTLKDGTLDDIYSLIATEKIYVNLNAARLSSPQLVKVFANQEIAQAYERITEISPLPVPNNFKTVKIAVGNSLSWDGEAWDVVNTGVTTTGLLRTDGHFVELPNTVMNDLISNGKIISEHKQSDVNQETVLRLFNHAKPKDIVEANRRYSLILPYLESQQGQTGITRTIRRWRNAYQQAQKLYGNGFVGLLPLNSNKGNRQPRIDKAVLEFMSNFISEKYETLKQRGQLRVYESFRLACKSHEPELNPPSFSRFCLEIIRRKSTEQTFKREGRRAAIQKTEFYWQLELTTPPHGSRPFEIVHIDHTELDVELVSSLASLSNCQLDISNTKHQNLGRPWASFMVDAFSRRLLGIYLTYDEPSYRSCMMAIRICVQRFKRFPQTIVVDGGREFNSHYFEQLMANYNCTLKHRPSANPRFGSVIERLFGTANTQFIYELAGNTQLTKRNRIITKSVSPSKHAIWTLGDLYTDIVEWGYSIYDNRPHPALGQSPNDTFNLGIALGGERLHRRVEYDDVFHLLTLPSPERGKRRIQPGQGVKIHNIYYWSNDFRDPEVEKTSVDVKYDPFNAGIAYALVNGQWVQCISNYYRYLQGRSEKEIQLVSTELLKSKRLTGCHSIQSDKELAEFLNSVEKKEEHLIMSRLKSSENQHVIELIEKQHLNIPNDQNPIDSSLITQEYFAEATESLNSNNIKVPELLEDSLEQLEYYGEF